MVDQQARHPTRAPGFVSRSIGRVQRALAPAPAPHLAVADGYELDLVARELRHDGRLVHLRPREFDLLATLAANPGRAFTRSQLIDLAWHLDGGIGPRAVDVHVHWLRAKIEPRPAQPVHLVTVRRFGYRLDPGGALTKP
jgi:DNA-binding response OmpR family regulator